MSFGREASCFSFSGLALRRNRFATDGGETTHNSLRFLKWEELDLEMLARENPLASADYREIGAQTVIEIRDVSNISPEERERIVMQVRMYGFARVKLHAKRYDGGTLLGLFNGLQLGTPYVPPYFSSTGIKSQNGVNTVTAAPGAKHNAFRTSNASGMHVDGVFNPFVVKTSINMMHTRAKEGGDSLIFNTTVAFLALARRDPEAAAALMRADAIETKSETKPDEIYATSPIVRVRADGVIECRLLMDITAQLEEAIVRDPAIGRAYQFFKSLMYEGSPYYLQFGMENGEALIINNIGVSHGRTAYEDDPKHPRLLYRVLSETSLIA